MNNNFKVCGWYLLKTHLTALAMFTLCRIISLIANRDSLSESTSVGDVAECLLRGLAVDNHTSCEAIALAAALLLPMCVVGRFPKWLVNIAVWGTAIIYAVAMAVCFSNIPYLIYQNVNLDVTAVSTLFMGTEVAGMILSADYAAWFLLGLVATVAVAFLDIKYGRRMSVSLPDVEGCCVRNILPCVCVIAVVVLGIRGRQSRLLMRIAEDQSGFKKAMSTVFGRPMNEAFCFFSNEQVLNFASFNACFALERDYKKWKKQAKEGIRYMDDAEADEVALRHLNYPSDSLTGYVAGKKPCVFLVLMESMTVNNMERFGDTAHLTPFLDSIYANSYSFKNFYSAGVRTQNGFSSVMSSQPVLIGVHSMSRLAKGRKLINSAFSDAGYSTQLIVSYELAFDDLSSFISSQWYSYVYSLPDYDKASVVNEWGPNDEYMYDFAFKKTDELVRREEKPVFTFLYSCSNHPPYIVPDEYKNTRSTERESMVLFCDAQLRKLYNNVRGTEWGRDAVFVFVADHGRPIVKEECPANTSQSHIPLIISSPDVPVKEDSTYGVQADIVPTVLSMLGIRYEGYNGLGVDLTQTDRDTIFYGNDAYYIGRTKGRVYLFNPRTEGHEIWDEDSDGRLVRSKDADDVAFDYFMRACMQTSYRWVTE